MSAFAHVPLASYRRYPESEMAARAAEFYADIKRRRTVREFAEKEIAPHIREWDRSGAHAEGSENRPHIRHVLADAAVLFWGSLISTAKGVGVFE